MHGRLYSLEHRVDARFEARVAAGLAEAATRGWPGPAEGLWLVESGGVPSGSLALTDEGDGVGWVRWFLLEPPLRGGGLGGRLLAELVAEASEHGFERLELETFSDLKVAARLYRQAGFDLCWTESGPRWGCDLLHYQHYELKLAQASPNTRRTSSSASTNRSISSGVV
jgi:GNAT superfamily N-acetyltransferase